MKKNPFQLFVFFSFSKEGNACKHREEHLESGGVEGKLDRDNLYGRYRCADLYIYFSVFRGRTWPEEMAPEAPIG